MFTIDETDNFLENIKQLIEIINIKSLSTFKGKKKNNFFRLYLTYLDTTSYLVSPKMHLALARKYRPQNFLEVIGQDPIVKTLQNSIESKRLHHAYIFCGVRGVGKTSMARIFAKSINCEKGPTIKPCQKCQNCQSITKGNSLDVIEIDGASNNLVDDIRELREQVKFLPTQSQYKIIIIDEVHMLSNSAFNALLKTLEEPPEHVIFIFATTESHKLPITILSRCQKYDFKKLNSPTLKKHLESIAKKEKIKIEDAAIHLISQCAQGSVRDALSLLDQICSMDSKSITESQTREMLGLGDRILLQDAFLALVQEDLNKALEFLNQIDERGIDLKLFAEELLTQFRHLILLESTKQMPSELSPAEAEFFNGLKSQTDLSLLLAQYQVLFHTIGQLAHTEFQKTTLEIAFVKINQIRNMIGLADLVDQIKNRKTSTPTTSIQKPKIPNSKTLNTNDKIPTTKNTQKATDWYGLVKWLTNEKPPLGSLLKDAVPISFSDQKIEIGVSSKSQTKGILIDRASNIEELINTHFGKKVDFKVSDLEEQKKKPSP